MSRQKKLDKMERLDKIVEKPKPEFNFKYSKAPGKFLFITKDLVIGYDEPLSFPLNLSMERGSRIVLTGSNGIGKTTLLKSLLGLISPPFRARSKPARILRSAISSRKWIKI